MKVEFIQIYLFFPKLVIFFIFIVYSSLSECERDKPIFKDNKCVSIYCDENQFKSGECIINNSIIKKRWINNIMTIENTNGDLILSLYKEDNIFLFGTSSSNNEERIFYGIESVYDSYTYPFGKNGKFESFIKKKIERSDNKELTNAAMCFFEFRNNKKKVFLVGSDNSYAEIIDLDKDSNEVKVYSQTELYKENKVIKGISSLLYLHNNYLNLVTITSSSDNNTISYFTLSLYKFVKSTFKIQHHREEEFVKGKYLSCFLSEKNQKCYLISCFYLDINNNFTISLYEDIYANSYSYFSLKNSSFVGKGYEIEENKNYFMKGVVSEGSKKTFGFYAFYSGDLNDIPTFLYKDIENGNISNKYDDFPAIYLYDYSFNNDIKFNDILSMREDNLIFISSLKNREVLIIAYMIFYKSSDKIQFLVRYYTILLKEYNNIKIFHVLKALAFYSEQSSIFFPSLFLAIDFSLYDSSQNSENDISNAGLIDINFPNINNRKIDFIEMAFKNNKKYILVNLTENFSINNNLFGFNPSNIDIFDLSLWYGDENIIYIIEESKEIIMDNLYFDINVGLIRVDLTDCNFEDMSIFEDYPAFIYSIMASPPNTSKEFNLYCDNINETYGDKDDDSSIPKQGIYSIYSEYFLEVKEELTIDCNENCTLCLKNNKSYCIVCEDKFTIIYNKDYKYGKKKVCQEINEVNNTEELFISIDSDTNIEESKIFSDTNLVDKISNK